MAEPMTVQRIRTEHGSHIEPGLDQQWTELDKLRWLCGVAKADADIDLCVASPSRSKLNGRAFAFEVTWRYSSGAVYFGYHDAWDGISAMIRGAELYRDSRCTSSSPASPGGQA